ncbi:MAG: Uma2 family endonuclease [Hyphomicrobiaceae bacterium]
MTIVLPTHRMSVDEFLAWSSVQVGGKYELIDGVVVMQQSQRWIHAETRQSIFDCLRSAITSSGIAYFAAPEGPAVRVHEGRTFEPDGLVAALPKPTPDSLEIPDPIIVVEVLSPSTAQIDVTVKLQGYFEVPSVQHYLIVDPDGRTVTHHRRKDGTTLETRILGEGTISLDPPGLVIDVAAIFAPLGQP